MPFSMQMMLAVVEQIMFVTCLLNNTSEKVKSFNLINLFQLHVNQLA